MTYEISQMQKDRGKNLHHISNSQSHTVLPYGLLGLTLNLSQSCISSKEETLNQFTTFSE